MQSLAPEFLPELNSEESSIYQKLIDLDQAHLFQHWPPKGTKDKEKHQQMQQLIQLDKAYPGGLETYLNNAKKLLQDSKDNINPFENYTPRIPKGTSFSFGSEAFLNAEREGIKLANKTAFVMVAGGLGERLGYSGIKIALPSNSCSGQSFIETYIKHILALEKRSNAINRENRMIPLCIMTSDDTHELTQSFLNDHNFFGMSPEQLIFVKQDKVPSLKNNEAHIAQQVDNPYIIDTKPHGHGDVHVLLHREGIVQNWQASGYEWIVFFQDTNGLIFNSIPAALSNSAEQRFEVNSIVVPRKAKEAAGAIVHLEHQSPEKSLTINVEYNQLDPLLKSTIEPKGDVSSDSTGNSPFPGNINVLIFSVPPYAKNLKSSKGLIPEFINPKYSDASKQHFKKPTRVESLMQDYPKLLTADAAVGFTQFDRWLCFSAVKNNLKDAILKAKQNLPPESASTAEHDIYYVYQQYLQHSGVDIPELDRNIYSEIPVRSGPKIILSPSFASCLSDLEDKVRGGSISPKSVLIVDGENIQLNQVKLDGTLIIKAIPEAEVILQDLDIQNEGWDFVELKGDEPEEIQMRGYKLAKYEEKVLEFNEPGLYKIDQSML